MLQFTNLFNEANVVVELSDVIYGTHRMWCCFQLLSCHIKPLSCNINQLYTSLLMLHQATQLLHIITANVIVDAVIKLFIWYKEQWYLLSEWCYWSYHLQHSPTVINLFNEAILLCSQSIVLYYTTIQRSWCCCEASQLIYYIYHFNEANVQSRWCCYAASQLLIIQLSIRLMLLSLIVIMYIQ